MSNGDRTKMERVEYTNDEQHLYINGKQWVSLERFTQIRNEINAVRCKSKKAYRRERSVQGTT